MRWWPRRWRAISLRGRLALGTGLIGVLALIAALTTAFGAIEIAERIEDASRAERRIELLGALSGRVGDYAIVAVEQASAAGESDQRATRLEARADAVRGAFDAIGRALGEAVEDARDLPETAQMRRATRSLGLARMRAQFEALDRALVREGAGGTTETLRSELDAFATRFSPLLNAMIEEERRERDNAFAAARVLRDRLVAGAVAVLVVALLAVALFHLAITRPLIDRLGEATAAAVRIGQGGFATRLARQGRDELGLLFAQLNRLAARLGRDRAAIDADRARLEEIVEERTRELRAANDRLERIDAERRRFFADVGHELRTPLTVILAEADLNLASRAPEPEEALASFATIRARARRLNRRIDDLLRVARSDTGRIELAEDRFDLAAAAAEAIDDSEVPARRRGLALELDAAGPVEVAGDPDWTRQVIAGLLDNAVRHSPQGGRIRVGVAALGDTAELTVTDEGSGIAEEDRERIFERFDRGRDAEAGRGFGVGLALARWVVERQSGAIGVASPAPRPVAPDARGPGTTVRVTLPLAQDPDTTPAPGTGPGEGMSA